MECVRRQAFVPRVYAGISTTLRGPVPTFGTSLIQETLSGIFGSPQKFSGFYPNLLLYVIDNHLGTVLAVRYKKKLYLKHFAGRLTHRITHQFSDYLQLQ